MRPPYGPMKVVNLINKFSRAKIIALQLSLYFIDTVIFVLILIHQKYLHECVFNFMKRSVVVR